MGIQVAHSEYISDAALDIHRQGMETRFVLVFGQTKNNLRQDPSRQVEGPEPNQDENAQGRAQVGNQQGVALTYLGCQGGGVNVMMMTGASFSSILFCFLLFFRGGRQSIKPTPSTRMAQPAGLSHP